MNEMTPLKRRSPALTAAVQRRGRHRQKPTHIRASAASSGKILMLTIDLLPNPSWNKATPATIATTPRIGGHALRSKPMMNMAKAPIVQNRM